MNSYLSRKIKTLSFIAIIGVLLMHGTYEESSQWYWLWFIQKFIGTLANSSVPFFFITSGYLFFCNYAKFNDTKLKIKKRLRTLLIPYIFWCIIFMLTTGIIGILVQLDTDYFELLRNGQISEFLLYCFWTPAAFHLWYVRDLFLIVLLSPVIALAIGNYPKTTLILSFIFFGIMAIVPVISWGLWWFSLGSFYGILKKQPFYGITQHQGLILFTFGIFSVLASVIWRFPITPDKWYSIPILFFIIVGVWNLYDCLRIRDRDFWICDFTFIIYCAHIPLTNIIKKSVYPMLINNSVGCTVGYLVTPIICIVVIIYISKLVRQKLPKLYYYITGGR